MLGSSHLALEDAARNGHVAVCDLLAQHPCMSAQAVRSAVCKAAAKGEIEVMQLLMSKCPDAASQHLRGSPMYEAVTRGQIQAIQLLIQHGADIDGKDGTPWTLQNTVSLPPLGLAAYGDQIPAVQWMLQHGADAKPLAQTTLWGNLSAVRLLQESGRDISTWGRVAFDAAILEATSKRDNVEVVLQLLSLSPPDYFLSVPHPDNARRDQLVRRFKNYLEQIQHQKAVRLLQAAVRHGHTGFVQLLQQEGVAAPEEGAPSTGS
jgi:ankyrin repeat protein